jgi:hypothetical protein
MDDRVSQVFSRLTVLCLLGVAAIATLTYANVINAKAATLIAAILTFVLFLADTLADGPLEPPPVDPNVVRLMALKTSALQTESLSPDTSPVVTSPHLTTLLETNPELLELIQASGNQLYLLKLRDYLVRKIKAEYERTGLVNIVSELQKVEAELDLLAIDYDPLEIPAGLTQLLASFDRQQRIQTYCNIIDALPFLPFKGLIKVYLRLRLR